MINNICLYIINVQNGYTLYIYIYIHSNFFKKIKNIDQQRINNNNGKKKKIVC